ncbi:MAG: propionyl-CoA synthetase [Nitrospinota bacterium]|nr:propionyl-CoA synthetase [Nitrospinota bacterium]
MHSRYESEFIESIDESEKYWMNAAKDLFWHKKWDAILDRSNPPFYRWFPGAKVNTCYNCLDRHVNEGRGEQVALIYDSPITGAPIQKFTYQELLEKVSKFAGGLQREGVVKGDRVLIYMPMVPEAVIAMLACARVGAVHSVVFGGFAPNELATRIDDAKPKMIISASCGIEPSGVIPYKPLLDESLLLSKTKPIRCVILQREQISATINHEIDIDWTDFMDESESTECVLVDSTDPLYILYTSGTTAQPKGVVRDNGGHMVALKWSMKNVYNVETGDVFWAASDIGWVVGHSYIVYGPLLQGCTSILFEGKPVGTPDAGVFWRIISEHKVKALFTAPTAFRAIKRDDPDAKLLKNKDLSLFETLFLAGERSDPDTVMWAEKQLGVPVIDHYWQTESGWPMLANSIGIEKLPVKYGSPTKPVSGFDFSVLDPECREVGRGEMGSLCVKLPLPPGCLSTLWNADDRFVDSYLSEFPGFYKTGDAGYMDEDGYVFVMSRTDDIINVAGHRLSTGAMEEVLCSHPDVAECAVVGIKDNIKGQIPMGFLVLKSGSEHTSESIVVDVVKLVRQQIGAVAAFKEAIVVKRLPKTRSGKILRGTMSKIVDGETYKLPATIDDPLILEEIKASLSENDY